MKKSFKIFFGLGFLRVRDSWVGLFVGDGGTESGPRLLTLKFNLKD